MVKPTQQEFSERVRKNIDYYNSFYTEHPSHIVEFYSCDAELKRLELTHTITEGELNLHRRLHGGAITWLVDSCAGILCRSYTGINACVTSNLNVNFIRGIEPVDPIIIRATLASEGRKLHYVNMEVRNRDTDQLYSTASAIFYVLVD